MRRLSASTTQTLLLLDLAPGPCLSFHLDLLSPHCRDIFASPPTLPLTAPSAKFCDKPCVPSPLWFLSLEAEGPSGASAACYLLSEWPDTSPQVSEVSASPGANSHNAHLAEMPGGSDVHAPAHATLAKPLLARSTKRPVVIATKPPRGRGPHDPVDKLGPRGPRPVGLGRLCRVSRYVESEAPHCTAHGLRAHAADPEVAATSELRIMVLRPQGL